MIEVNILGYSFPLKGNFEPEHIRQIALSLDSKMREVQSALQTKSVEKTAIITALNLEDELNVAQEAREVILNELENRTEKLINSMDVALKETY